MKIVIERSQLIRALSLLDGVANPKAYIPGHENALCEVAPDAMVMTALNNEGVLTVTIPGEADKKGAGAIALPVRKFLAVVKTFDTANVTLETTGKAANYVTVTAERNKAMLKGLVASTFEHPALPLLLEDYACVEAGGLEWALKHVAFIASHKQEGAAYSWGVRFQMTTDALALAATASMRLALAATPLTVLREPAEAVIPIRMVDVLLNLLGQSEAANPVRVRPEEHRWLFDFRGETLRAQLATQLLDVYYPDIAAVIPKASGIAAVVSEKELSAHLRPVWPFSDRVQISAAPDGLRFFCNGPLIGDSTAILDCKPEGAWDEIHVDAGYLRAALSSLHGVDALRLEMTAHDHPIVFRLPERPDYVHVIAAMTRN